MSVLALTGMAGTCYFMMKNSQAQERAEACEERLQSMLKAQKEDEKNKAAASAACQELQVSYTESQKLRDQNSDWRQQVTKMQKERDEALLEAKRQREQALKNAAERDKFKAAASNPQASPRSSQASPRTSQAGADDIYREIDATIRSIQKKPPQARGSELCALKRSFHPDAQRMRSMATQQLFTQLSQYINSHCEAHLRQNCRECEKFDLQV